MLFCHPEEGRGWCDTELAGNYFTNNCPAKANKQTKKEKPFFRVYVHPPSLLILSLFVENNFMKCIYFYCVFLRYFSSWNNSQYASRASCCICII